MSLQKERLFRVLTLHFQSEKQALEWWNQPNRRFEYRSPEEIFEHEPEKVAKYIHEHFHQ